MAAARDRPSYQPSPRELLRERLADLEHEQWMDWSRQLAAGESLSANRLARWKANWVPYAALSESDKEQDRAYADRILELLEEFGLLS